MPAERREQVTRVGIVRVNGQPEELDGSDGRVCQEDANASCCAKDEGGPFEAALWGEASNCRKLLRKKKAAVVNVPVKRRGIDRVMWGSERRAEANLW